MIERRLAAAALVVALACGARAAGAQAVDPEMTALLRQGVELRRRGDDEGALAAFRRAHERAPSGNTLGQMGLAEQALGRWVDAERHVREALAASGDPWVQRNRAALDRAYTAIGLHVGQLEVRGGPPGAEVLLNGTLVGTLPLAAPLYLEAGRAVLEVRARGHYPFHRDVVIEGNGRAREVAELRRIPSDPADTVPHGTPRAPAGAARHGTDAGATQRALGWTALGLGVAAGAGAVVASIARENLVAQYDRDSSCPGRQMPNTGSCAALIADVDTWQVVRISALVAGGALTATGIALVLFASSRGSRENTAASVSCMPGVTGAGITCVARF